jgi:hypothetical protein
LTYIGGVERRYPVLLVKLINKILNALVESFCEGAVPAPAYVKVRKV